MNRRESCFWLASTLAAPTLLHAQAASPTAKPEFVHVDWSRHASIYEANIRQHTPEGTLAAFAKDLPRIQKMGVDILWVMPVQPIGVKNRKGGLGSYYSIRDYTAVNPEFGTLADFKRLVQGAHALGMKVILDWVANHTAWDHPWVSGHPDWYIKDAKGEISGYAYQDTPDSPPEYWLDVVGLDYRQPALWPAMTEAMLFWLRETGIDGFRCDVAKKVPTPFWEQARAQMEKIKPVFMLAEGDLPEHHRRAFDATYDWHLQDTFKKIAKGQGGPANIQAWWARRQALYPHDAYGLSFTANHDSNSWDGTDRELFGDAYPAFAVLTATLPGMPLVLAGQESNLDKRLEFFEKDAIAWKDYPRQAFYTQLLHFKRRHAALANGQYGGPVQWLNCDNPAVLAFERVKGHDRVRVHVNLSAQPQNCLGRKLAAWGWDVSPRIL